MDKRAFGERLRRLRDARGLSQEELARRIGSHEITISKWERGEHIPRMTKIQRLAAQLHVGVAELLGQSDGAADDAVALYLESPLAQARADEGAPITEGEIAMLRYIASGHWIEGGPSPRTLDRMLDLIRSDPAWRGGENG